MSSIDEIKSRLDIVDLVSESVQLRHTGKNYSGFCPFHPNTRTSSFVVFPETGTWRCFGQCNEGGDIFRFVMKKENWDFGETLRYLAEKAGVQLRPQTAEDQAAAEEHDHLRALLEEAVTFYRHNLLNTPAGLQALEYLHKRGLNDEILEAFGLGYAPNAWEAAIHHFKEKGYSEQELSEAGLVTERESGGNYDRFRHRIMIPIWDERGRMAGFGARILNPNDVPKFINSPQTPIFDKGHLLYGLERAKKAIRTIDQAVIVEGYLDVIALHQAGFTNAISPMGTALTDQQLRLLKRFTRRFILALDPDAAGNQATLRGLQVARQAMDRESEPVFDARGLLSHESRLQADIRVTTLPEGMDPDDVVKRDPAEWEKIIENAKPVVIHVMDALASGRDLDDPKVKTEIASQVLPLISEAPNPIERDTYRQRLARLLKVDERALMEDSASRSRRVRQRSGSEEPLGAKPRKPPRSLISGPANDPLEAHCIGILIRRPDLVFRIDRELQKHGLMRLSSQDFDRSEYQTIFGLIEESLAQDASEPLNFVLNHLSEPLMETADELLRGSEKIDLNEERVLEDLMRTLLELRRRDVRQGIDHLRHLMEEPQEQGDLMANEYLPNMAQFAQVRQRIDRALGQYTSRAMSKA
jgi:DNA primase